MAPLLKKSSKYRFTLHSFLYLLENYSKYEFLYISPFTYLEILFQPWCIPLHTGSMVYHLGFQPPSYMKKLLNLSSRAFLQDFVYKYHKDLGGY
jgi:hypothetical protein